MHLFAERGDARARACKNTMAKTIYSWRRKLLGCVESGANCEWLRCVECERVYFPFLVLWLLPFCAVIIIIIDVTSLLWSYFYCHLCFCICWRQCSVGFYIFRRDRRVAIAKTSNGGKWGEGGGVWSCLIRQCHRYINSAQVKRSKNGMPSDESCLFRFTDSSGNYNQTTRGERELWWARIDCVSVCVHIHQPVHRHPSNITPTDSAFWLLPGFFLLLFFHVVWLDSRDLVQHDAHPWITDNKKVFKSSWFMIVWARDQNEINYSSVNCNVYKYTRAHSWHCTWFVLAVDWMCALRATSAIRHI